MIFHVKFMFKLFGWFWPKGYQRGTLGIREEPPERRLLEEARKRLNIKKLWTANVNTSQLNYRQQRNSY